MTGWLVFIVVLVLLTTRTRRGRRRWKRALGGLGLVLAWAATLVLPRSSRTTGKPVQASTRPRAAAPVPRVTRKARTWPAQPWKPRKYAPGDERPGQGPRYFPPALKAELMVMSGGRCAYCGSVRQPRADHKHPYSWGGKTIIENGQILCDPCNVRKGAKWTDVHDPALMELVCVPHMLLRNRFRKARV